MIYRLGLAAALLLTSVTAFAADDRIQTVTYDPDHVVKVIGRPGVQSTIEFASDERIENVAVGNSSAWQITPNRRASALFLKPLARATATNMTVITDRRVYMFDLVARSGGATVYAMRFRYPDEKPSAAQAPKMAEGAAEAEASFTPARLNFGWRMKGHKRLLPGRVFDDGSSLYLSWDQDTPLPAILTQSNEGNEGPVNYRTAGDYIVIDPVPGNLLLRQGKMMARLWRSAPVSRPAPAPVAKVPAVPRRPDIVARAPAPQQPRVATSAARFQQPQLVTAAATPRVPAAAATPRMTAAAASAAAQLGTFDVKSLLTDQLSETAHGK